MTDRLRYYHEENIVNLIDQLEVKFNEELNDICISKAEVIAAIGGYFKEIGDQDIGISKEDEAREKLLHRKLETYD